MAGPDAPQRREVFDTLAARWDVERPAERVAAAVERGLSLLGDLSGLDVVDIGCGAGRLEPFLLPRLGSGSIVAVDFAPEMIARGAVRCRDPRVTWLCRDVLETGLGDATVNLVLCFNAFPHFPDGLGVLREVRRWLRRRGAFLLWHDLGRESLAEVHRRAGESVERDLLPPVAELADGAVTAGLAVERAEEDGSSYTLLGKRPG